MSPVRRCARACRRSISTPMRIPARSIIRGTVTGPQGKPVRRCAGRMLARQLEGLLFALRPDRRAKQASISAVRCEPDADGKYEFRTLMPVGYGCPPQGATQQLLNALARHGNRPAHVHFFVTSDKYRKLTTQINIEGDPLIWDDFAYATREDLIPACGRKDRRHCAGHEGRYVTRTSSSNIELTPLVQARTTSLSIASRASATA